MGHVDKCYLAGVEDGYQHRTELCKVNNKEKKRTKDKEKKKKRRRKKKKQEDENKKRRRLCHVERGYRFSSLISGTTQHRLIRSLVRQKKTKTELDWNLTSIIVA
jgi:hypothetical protein